MKNILITESDYSNPTSKLCSDFEKYVVSPLIGDDELIISIHMGNLYAIYEFEWYESRLSEFKNKLNSFKYKSKIEEIIYEMTCSDGTLNVKVILKL